MFINATHMCAVAGRCEGGGGGIGCGSDVANHVPMTDRTHNRHTACHPSSYLHIRY